MIKIFWILGFLAFCAESVARSFDAELVSHKTVVEISNGQLRKEVYYEIRINNRAGDKHTKIAIPHSKLVSVSKLNAFIKDADGRVVKQLKKSDIVEKSSISAISFYEDDFVKEFTLRHNSYPYTIVYSYQVQQNEFLYVDYWVPVIDEKIPTLSASLTVSAPADFTISYKNIHVEDPVINVLGNRVEYHWETSYTDMISPEGFSPPIANFFPSVIVIPEDFSFDIKGSLKDWTSFGNWQYGLLQGINELPANEKRKILDLVKNIDDDKEKVKILYHYLQDATRYINVTIETGGLKPYPASYVANNKYGDCKALTNYFKSVLEFIQIPSYYSIVYAGSPNRVMDKDFPSQQFNHAILYVPLEDEDVWLDCTSNTAFNHLGTFTQNRDAFVIDYNKSTFVKTPTLQPNDVLETRRIDVNYDRQHAVVNFKNSYKGDAYERIFYLDKKFNESEKSRIVRNYLVADGFQLVSYAFSEMHRDSVKIDLNYQATSPSLYKHFGNDILMGNMAFLLPGFEKPANRKLPVQLDYPVYKVDTLVYEIPVGYELHCNQNNYTISNKYGEYSLNIHEDDDKVMVTKSLILYAGMYPVAEYAQFYDFYNSIVEIENKTHLSLSKYDEHD
jgi:hypothetical protein